MRREWWVRWWREDVMCRDRREKDRTGEWERASCVYMTNKALDIKKITIIKHGNKTAHVQTLQTKPPCFNWSDLSIWWIISFLGCLNQYLKTINSLSCCRIAVANCTILQKARSPGFQHSNLLLQHAFGGQWVNNTVCDRQHFWGEFVKKKQPKNNSAASSQMYSLNKT